MVVPRIARMDADECMMQRTLTSIIHRNTAVGVCIPFLRNLRERFTIYARMVVPQSARMDADKGMKCNVHSPELLIATPGRGLLPFCEAWGNIYD